MSLGFDSQMEHQLWDVSSVVERRSYKAEANSLRRFDPVTSYQIVKPARWRLSPTVGRTPMRKGRGKIYPQVVELVVTLASEVSACNGREGSSPSLRTKLYALKALMAMHLFRKQGNWVRFLVGAPNDAG